RAGLRHESQRAAIELRTVHDVANRDEGAVGERALDLAARIRAEPTDGTEAEAYDRRLTRRALWCALRCALRRALRRVAYLGSLVVRCRVTMHGNHAVVRHDHRAVGALE